MAVEARTKVKIGLWVAQLAIAILASLYVYFLRISIPHCGDSCDFVGIQTISDVYALSAGVIVLACGILLLILRKVRLAWLIPSVGIFLIIAGAVIATQMTRTAMLFE